MKKLVVVGLMVASSALACGKSSSSSHVKDNAASDVNSAYSHGDAILGRYSIGDGSRLAIARRGDVLAIVFSTADDTAVTLDVDATSLYQQLDSGLVSESGRAVINWTGDPFNVGADDHAPYTLTLTVSNGTITDVNFTATTLHILSKSVVGHVSGFTAETQLSAQPDIGAAADASSDATDSSKSSANDAKGQTLHTANK